MRAGRPITRGTCPQHYLPTRFRALALFGRRPPERVVRSSLPATEKLHTCGLMHRSKALLPNSKRYQRIGLVTLLVLSI